MGRLRERGPEPNYNETNSDDDGASDASLGSVDETSPQPEAAARLKRGPYAKRPHALGQKRANGDLEGAPAARRRRWAVGGGRQRTGLVAPSPEASALRLPGCFTARCVIQHSNADHSKLARLPAAGPGPALRPAAATTAAARRAMTQLSRPMRPRLRQRRQTPTSKWRTRRWRLRRRRRRSCSSSLRSLVGRRRRRRRLRWCRSCGPTGVRKRVDGWGALPACTAATNIRQALSARLTSLCCLPLRCCGCTVAGRGALPSRDRRRKTRRRTRRGEGGVAAARGCVAPPCPTIASLAAMRRGRRRRRRAAMVRRLMWRLDATGTLLPLLQCKLLRRMLKCRVGLCIDHMHGGMQMRRTRARRRRRRSSLAGSKQLGGPQLATTGRGSPRGGARGGRGSGCATMRTCCW